jgi:hypothetical protein
VRWLMKRKLQLDIAKVVAQFQQKNCEVAGRIARRIFGNEDCHKSQVIAVEQEMAQFFTPGAGGWRFLGW